MVNQAVGMPCPVDGTALVMSERSGIEIDYCPTCRGVWLDRGELDKIIERSADHAAPVPPPRAQAPMQPPMPPQAPAWPGGGSHSGYPGGDHRYGKHKRKKSFFEELFD